MSTAARPTLDERAEYTPRSRQERFIVPLLKNAIERELARIFADAGTVPKSVLDVGCGGQPLRPLLEASGWTYFGLDTQAQPGTPLDFCCAIDAALPRDVREAGPFGLIVCTEVLEHVADWSQAFSNLRSLLAPGGRVLITCPHVYPLHEEPFDFWRPTPHALRAFAGRFDFHVEKIDQLGDAWDVLGTVLAASAPKPASRGALGVVGGLVCALLRPARSVLIWLIGLRLVRALVKPAGKVYLSNLAVLRAPERAS